VTGSVVLISRRVLEDGEPIFFVARSASGHWEFHPQDHLDRPRDDLVQSTLATVVALDASVEAVLDLPEGWHAWRDTESGALTQRCPSPTGPTFLVEFEARPSASHPDRTSFRGAFVNCYIRCSSLQEARRAARQELESEHWEIVSDGDSHEVDDTTYEEQSDGWQYVRQAQIDGIVLAFHTYRLE